MEQTHIEKHLENTLIKELGPEKGKDWHSFYQSARNYLMQDILPNIKAKEPELTDHGEKHIRNVLDNAWRLLIYDESINEKIDKYKDINKLTCYDLYILCLSILFHDVGNINGRNEHNKKVLSVYDAVRKNDSKFKPERHLISKTTKAHCGKTDLGSLDTLVEVEEKDSLLGEPIQLREIASILRLADELAEGPQRTSDYLLAKNIIPKHSKIYHKYSQITEIFIDRGNERIVLKYLIDIKNETKTSLKKLLTFTYNRILKMDEERKYTKFYSNLLTPFKKIEFTFNFTKNGEELFKMPIRGSLQDTCVIPGKERLDISSLIKEFKDLSIDNVTKKLKLRG